MMVITPALGFLVGLKHMEHRAWLMVTSGSMVAFLLFFSGWANLKRILLVREKSIKERRQNLNNPTMNPSKGQCGWNLQPRNH